MHRRMVKSKAVWAFLLSSLIVLATFTNLNIEVSGVDPFRVYVNPPTQGPYSIGTTFDVTVEVEDVPELFSWEFRISWDPNILGWGGTFEKGDFLSNVGNTFFWPDLSNVASGIVHGSETLLGIDEAVGSGTLVTLSLTVIAEGGTSIDLSESILIHLGPGPSYDILIYPLEDYTLEDGYYGAAPPPQYTLTIGVVGSGTTNPAPGPHVYNEGSMVSVDAIPAGGWMLDHWELDGVDVGAADPYTVTMNDDHTLTAVFVEIPVVQYTLTIEVVGSGTTDPAPGPHVYDEGSMVSVDAIPAGGWMLDHWLLDGVDVGAADPYTVTMDADHTLTAVFTEGLPTIDGLIDLVEEFYDTGSIDRKDIKNALLDKLNAAKAKIERSQVKTAENILNAFINQVKAQTGKHITPEAAEILIEYAEYIINNL